MPAFALYFKTERATKKQSIWRHILCLFINVWWRVRQRSAPMKIEWGKLCEVPYVRYHTLVIQGYDKGMIMWGISVRLKRMSITSVMVPPEILKARNDTKITSSDKYSASESFKLEAKQMHPFFWTVPFGFQQQNFNTSQTEALALGPLTLQGQQVRAIIQPLKLVTPSKQSVYCCPQLHVKHEFTFSESLVWVISRGVKVLNYSGKTWI